MKINKMYLFLIQTTSSSGKSQPSPVEHNSSPGNPKTPWNLACLRPAPPSYTLKNFGKSDSTDPCRSPRICSMFYIIRNIFLPKTPNLNKFVIGAILFKFRYNFFSFLQMNVNLKMML